MQIGFVLDTCLTLRNLENTWTLTDPCIYSAVFLRIICSLMLVIIYFFNLKVIEMWKHICESGGR